MRKWLHTAKGLHENHILILITTMGIILCKPSLYQTHDDDNDDICYIKTML